MEKTNKERSLGWIVKKCLPLNEFIKVNIIDDEKLACPECDAYWEHPCNRLNYPNRFKVDDFCKCYNPDCKVTYYNPFTKEIGLPGDTF